MRALLVMVVCSVNLLAAGQEMNVAICNLGSVSEFVLAQAKSEANLVYSSAGVHITWHHCEEFPTVPPKDSAPWFAIRLRADKPPGTVGPASLDVMGKAFVEERGGYLADAYFQAIQGNAQLHNGDAGVLLGFVMAHELGHLILGAGHTQDGVMQAAWGPKEMHALRQRWLKFSESCGERIRLALDARTRSVK
jgi:hypothetical protein